MAAEVDSVPIMTTNEVDSLLEARLEDQDMVGDIHKSEDSSPSEHLQMESAEGLITEPVLGVRLLMSSRVSVCER